MNEKQLIHVLGHLAEELVPGDVDLWPAIRVHFETSNQHSHTGDLSMNANLAPSRRLRLASRRLRLASRRLRLAAIVVLTLLVISGLVFATPQGRVWAQSLLRFFTRSESNSIPAPTDIPLVWVQQTPGVPAATTTPLPGLAFETNCGPLNNPKCSIEQIRSKVSFAIKELGSIPEGMYYLGATGDPNHVYIQYLTPDHSTGLLLMQEPWTGSADQTDWKIGPNAVLKRYRSAV